MQTDIIPSTELHRPDADAVVSAIDRRSFATLATASPEGVPHVAGVLYERVGPHLFVNTLSTSRKARNVAASGRVAMTIPIRRLPIGPPSSVQFQASAELLDLQDPPVVAAIESGRLESLTGHGEVDLPGCCFVRIVLPTRLPTYGLGMSLWSLIRDPLSAAGVVEIEAWS